jgi:O-antigen/teichoic acid export membrane protein
MSIQSVYRGFQNLIRHGARLGSWVALSKGMGSFERLARAFILARLLSPHDFGTFGVALFVLSCLDTFTEPGIQTILVQHREDLASYLDTAFTFNLLRGIALAAVVFFSAPYVAFFFKAPDAVHLMKAAAMVPLARAFINPATVQWTRALDFRSLFFLDLWEACTTLIVAVGLGLAFRNIWALLLSLLAGLVARAVASHTGRLYRPRLGLSAERFRKVIQFGRWVLGSNIVGFLGTQGDTAYVARILGGTQLGLYQMAFRISVVPRTTVTEIIGQIAYPSLSSRAGNPELLRRHYLRIYQICFGVSAAIAILMTFAAHPMVRILLGEAWIPCVPVLRVLIWAIFLRSIAVIPGWMLYAIKQPQSHFALALSRLLVLAAVIYPLTKTFGMVGTGVAVLFSSGAMVVASLVLVKRSLGLSWSQHFVWNNSINPEALVLDPSA